MRIKSSTALTVSTIDTTQRELFKTLTDYSGSSRLREIFLKTDNLLKGKYLAELTQGEFPSESR